MESSALEDTDWRLYLYRPVEEAAAAIRQITYIVLFMILVCILLVSCTSAGLSRLVVHPLEQLSSYIAKVESGNYEFTITSDLSLIHISYITPAAVPRIPRPAIHKARHILIPEIFIVISVPPPGGGTNIPPAYHRQACATAELNSLKKIINIPLLLHGPHNDSRNQIFLQKRINQQERNHRHHDLGRIQVSVG